MLFESHSVHYAVGRD